MRKIRAFFLRLTNVFQPNRREREMSEELEANLQLHIDSYTRIGLSPEEARRRAVLEFGTVESAKESYRDRAGLPLLETLVQDLRYAFRTLHKQPGFTLVTVLTLALGVSASTTMFSVVQAVLLRPLPYPQPDRLVEITETNPLKHWTNAVAAPANLADWQQRNTVFTGIAGYNTSDLFLSGSGDPQRLRGLRATGNLFEVLGVRPALGRAFRREETFEGKERVAVLSFDLWQAQFLGDRHIVGRTITLSGISYVVIGVMPRDFFFPDRETRLFLPLGVKPSFFVKNRRPHMLHTIARLRPGVTVAQARSDLQRIARQLERMYPETNTQMGVRLDGFHDTLTAEKRPALLLLLTAVGIFFLIVCSNVANLQLGRGATRAREMEIRQALGAGRRRLMRQLLTESCVLSVFGGVFGLALALVARGALLRWAPTALPAFAELRLDAGVILFHAILTLGAPLAFGMIPALVSSRRPESLRDHGNITRWQSSVTRHVLVAGEVALSVLLVTGAGLLLRSLLHLEQIHSGFQPEQAVSFSLFLPDARYPTEEQGWRTLQAIEDRLRALPGVQAVGAATTLALHGYGWTADATPEGRGRFPGDYERELRHNDVTPGYFRALGAQLLRGRPFDGRDTAHSAPVTIVNEALEKAYFHGENAVGKRIKFGRPQDPVNKDAPWVTVVGVIADLKQDGLDKPVWPEAFTPMAQQVQNQATFVLRGSSSPEILLAEARREVRAVDPQLVLTDMLPLPEVIRASVGDQRFRTSLLSAFAGVALFLAALGVYGVLAYSVTQRTKEMGVRLALGASPQQLFRMVLRDGMRPVLLGSVLGFLGAGATTGLLRSFLFGITTTDPLTYGVTLAVMTGVALSACIVPAWRAIQVDPLVSLRDS